ncbi:MAG TPA: hypothetical protein PKW66_26730, partial [Polyangiaceae bacterium]|nr:hypothetical protein [Polyangiaceae bacterium]
MGRTLRLSIAFACVLFPTLAHAGDTWTTPHPGVRYLYRTTSFPRRIVATQVDLCANGVKMRATAPTEKKRTTSSFAKLVGAKVA